MERVESTTSRAVDVAGHTVESYRAAVLALLRPLAVERVAVEAALGRVTKYPVVARTPVPLFDNAAMDGFAVRARDVLGATAERPVRLAVVGHRPAGPRRAGTVGAGTAGAGAIGAGEAVRIMTGAP